MRSRLVCSKNDDTKCMRHNVPGGTGAAPGGSSRVFDRDRRHGAPDQVGYDQNTRRSRDVQGGMDMALVALHLPTTPPR
ncbi:hypothetical protein RSOLAG1IB_08162 [Rhizoctonia solani AG-1 IB]|uniref:Uncharacterized protein n=1 Tax=Thanatephorus cucumeris (strain AG1-IB / isolate 7/3/14) TaxID=1108050 RepID=A0A0B7FIX1_THACB|nr:hypothetical protein RSOLAG1IB_08162 [Rhizoctonia solani AG-1 IB]